MNTPPASTAQPPASEISSSPGRMRRAWGRFMAFLEIIGLRDERKDVDHAGQLARFKLYHTEFRKLIHANNSFLETLAELDQKRSGASFIDHAYIQRKMVRAVADVHAMVDGLQVVSGGRYPGLRDALGRIAAELNTLCQDAAGAAEEAELVLDIDAIRASHADLVGGKMSNLGELRNALGLPTPDGFAVTTEAYRLLIEDGGLRSWIQSEHLNLLAPEDVAAISAGLRDGIQTVAIPERLSRDMREAHSRLRQRFGGDPMLAVRSSAVGEDSALSFAGQFKSLLNVAGAGLNDAYLQVAASLYSPEAVHYRMLHHIPGETAEMAVGVIAMQDATAAGVAFSRDPNAPDSGQVLIQAVHGLGVPLVDGDTSPEITRVRLDAEPPELARTPSTQTVRYVSRPGEGIGAEAMGSQMAELPCLSDSEALQLARWAQLLERHFGSPQDLEWAVTPARKLILLQSRPLRVLQYASKKEPPEEGFALLLDGGEVACPGVAAGRAVHMDPDGDFEAFPEGAVLVAKRSSPKFVRLMARAKAIVTDAGSTTGHMASLARELRVPALLNTRTATQTIPVGSMVTVDAASGYVYAGEVAPLLARRMQIDEGGADGPGRRLTSELDFLERALTLVAPLNLTDPQHPSFAPEGCRTLHDLTRFIHEKSYQEMFGLGDQLGDFRAASYQLDVNLPIDLFIIDLGGGLKEVPRGRTIKRGLISSVAMRAVLDGMLDRRIPRYGARPMDMGGLFSVMMRHATTSPEEQKSFQMPCYALISDCYVNYSARVGYHFSVLDAYCSPTPNKNYINLLFRGGAADVLRRSRRTLCIANILKHYGFVVTLNADAVIARLNKGSREETKIQLEMIGRLLQFFRQMDAAMASDEHMRVIQEAFLAGDFSLSVWTGEKKEAPPNVGA